MVLVTLLLGVLGGCDTSADTKRVASSLSVSDLLTKLPKLKPFGIDSCSYTLERSTVGSRVPSPSDVRIMLRGSAQLSAEGYNKLRSRFEWRPISRGDVPKNLRPILRAGVLLFSQELNESFADNPTYGNGFVVILERGASRTIFLLATNIDYPIE